jgi:hypothetical protein
LGKEAGGFFLCGDEAWQLPGAAAASEIGALDGTCALSGRAQALTRRQRVAFLFSYESWWEVLVTLQFVASDFI